MVEHGQEVGSRGAAGAAAGRRGHDRRGAEPRQRAAADRGHRRRAGRRAVRRARGALRGSRPPAAHLRPPRHARGPGRRDRPPAARSRRAGAAHRPPGTAAAARHQRAPGGVRLPRPPPADVVVPRVCRSGSATGSSATSTSPRRPGAGDFTPGDEEIVIALAATAGVAIENARLYDEGARRQRWLAAMAEITAILTAGDPGADAVQTIADRAREVAGADVAWIVAGQDRASLELQGDLRREGRPRRHEALVAGPLARRSRGRDRGHRGRRRHRHRPPGPRRLAGLRLAEPRSGRGGAAAVGGARGRRARPGVEPRAGRGVLLAGPRPGGQLRRARHLGPADRRGPRGPAATGDAGGPRPHRARAARRGDPAAVRRGARTAGDLPAGRPPRRRRPPRPGRRRPGRDDQGHPPVDLRAGQHGRLPRHPGRGHAAGGPGRRHAEVPADPPVSRDPSGRWSETTSLRTCWRSSARRCPTPAGTRTLGRSRSSSAPATTSCSGWPTTGVGLDSGVHESGLRNMRERAERRGGAFVVESARGEGTTLTWSVPAS